MQEIKRKSDLSQSLISMNPSLARPTCSAPSRSSILRCTWTRSELAATLHLANISKPLQKKKDIIIRKANKHVNGNSSL